MSSSSVSCTHKGQSALVSGHRCQPKKLAYRAASTTCTFNFLYWHMRGGGTSALQLLLSGSHGCWHAMALHLLLPQLLGGIQSCKQYKPPCLLPIKCCQQAQYRWLLLCKSSVQMASSVCQPWFQTSATHCVRIGPIQTLSLCLPAAPLLPALCSR